MNEQLLNTLTLQELTAQKSRLQIAAQEMKNMVEYLNLERVKLEQEKDLVNQHAQQLTVILSNQSRQQQQQQQQSNQRKSIFDILPQALLYPQIALQNASNFMRDKIMYRKEQLAAEGELHQQPNLEDILAVNAEVTQSNPSSTEIPKRPRRKIFDDFKPGNNSQIPPISNQKEKANVVLQGAGEVKPPAKVQGEEKQYNIEEDSI